jgi:hypothetical protein
MGIFERKKIVGGGHFEIRNRGPKYEWKNWHPFFSESVKFLDAFRHGCQESTQKMTKLEFVT